MCRGINEIVTFHYLDGEGVEKETKIGSQGALCEHMERNLGEIQRLKPNMRSIDLKTV